MAKRSKQQKRMVRKPSGRKASRLSSRRTQPSRKPRHVPTRGLYGWITHTELASSDPAATKAWCTAVLGWSFKPSFPTPGGEYHLFTYSDKGGGGIRSTNPPEVPSSVPYIHVADARAAFEKALREGAAVMMPPERVMEGVTIALVRAPGGVPIGFSGP
jgi:predicted enzyme related to lactoylglutathione lyase